MLNYHTYTPRRVRSSRQNRRRNDNLKQQAQALFKSWFVDFEPFKNSEFVESELGKIPLGWEVIPAENRYKINIGKTPPRQESIWFSYDKSQNIRWVSISDLGSCEAFISDSSEYLTPDAVERFNIIIVPKDTVLLSFKLTVGRVAIAKEDMTTNEAIARFYIPDKCYMEYTYLMLKNYDYTKLGSTSSIATAVNSKIIKGMNILMPAEYVIKNFHDTTQGLFEKMRLITDETERLSNIRDSILPKLMSGELKINDLNC